MSDEKEPIAPAHQAREGLRLGDPHNWAEDYGDENGMYSNICDKCERIFIGHKYRRVCKECAAFLTPRS